MLVFKKLFTFFKACCSITLDTESFTLNAIMLNVILTSVVAPPTLPVKNFQQKNVSILTKK